MIESIVRFSIRQRWLVMLLGLALLVGGVVSATQLPIDAVPDITNNQVQINTVAAALGPEEVERQITFPIEQTLAGLPRLKETRSISQFGLSQVTVVFEDGVDIYFARNLVHQRLQEAQGELPSGTKSELAPVSTGLGEVYQLKLEGERYSLMERRTMMDWIVRPQLRTVPGLAEVNTFGGTAKQIQVQLDPEKLATYGLTVRDAVAALAANNANAGGAYLQRGGEQQLVRTVGLLRGPEDIAQVVVGHREGVPILMGQLGRVVDAGMVRSGAVTENGRHEEVYAIAMLLMGENGRIVVNRVKDKVASIEKSLPEGTRLVPFMDRTTLIQRTLNTATTNLVEGGVLVIGLLFLFLLQVRAGLIVSSAIPLAMLFAILGMRQFGVSANLMSLGAIDFGIIVDGAVIIVENVVRRLAEAREHLGRDLTEEERIEMVYAGTVEVRKASQFGELIIIAAYLPILALVGIEGKMFRPMGLTVIMALIGAMVLSFTLVPALCAQFLRVKVERRNPPLEWLTARYRRGLEAALDARWLTVGGAAVFLAMCLPLFGRLGSEFIPELDEGAIAIQSGYPPSMSLETVIERSTVLEGVLLREFPDEVSRVVTRIGRPEIATDPMLVTQTDTLVELHPRERWRKAGGREELQTKMSAALAKVPGVGTSFSQPIKMRMSELIEGVGIRADLALKLFGNDPAVLDREGQRLQRIVAAVPGAADVSLETTAGLPQLQVRIRRDRIARYGINVADVNEVVEAALGGKEVTEITDGAQRFGVAVRLPEAARDRPEKIARLMVPAPNGTTVPLAELADLVSVDGPVQISRESGQRRVVIQANVRGRDLGSFVQEVQRRVDREIKLPTGYHVEYGGTFEQLQSGRARLAVVVPVTFGLVFLMLFTTFGNARQALIVFTGIPFAATGGILALLLRGLPFSISAGIGFIALAGIAVLNGVVMVTFINHLRAEGASARSATIRGAVQRLRPVLMTASVAGFGFLPMALSHGAGGEVQRPLATVVIGGLITSTVLTLFVLPTLLAWTEREPVTTSP
jgi:cobalt-zinc-cadmium resistance protein CzcA